LFLDTPIPLNAGCLDPVKNLIPEGSFLNPKEDSAVAAGNVEISQLIVDALLGAMGVMAASQGTMNNLSFGNDRFQYYETLGGGTGAGPGFHGASAVHSHMTNSRLTDPEVLERRFPVRVVETSIRPSSGGRGLFFGGDGMVRTLRFLKPCRVSLITGRRRVAPHGLAGGLSGKPGKNVLIKGSGGMLELDPVAEFDVEPNDTLRIETPGGGGYGFVH
jgi:5-oxoprolinase (ATP-hydrolysing)